MSFHYSVDSSRHSDDEWSSERREMAKTNNHLPKVKTQTLSSSSSSSSSSSKSQRTPTSSGSRDDDNNQTIIIGSSSNNNKNNGHNEAESIDSHHICNTSSTTTTTTRLQSTTIKSQQQPATAVTNLNYSPSRAIYSSSPQLLISANDDVRRHIHHHQQQHHHHQQQQQQQHLAHQTTNSTPSEGGHLNDETGAGNNPLQVTIGLLLDMVIRGHGDKLIGRCSNEPQLQQFLDQVPYLLERIQQIHLASSKWSLTDFIMLIDNRQSLIGSLDQIGCTILHKAIMFNNVELAEYLVDCYGQQLINVQDKQGRSALHYAASLEDKHLYRFLMAQKIVRIMLDNKGRTPMYYLAHSDQLQMKNLINLSRKLNANFQTNVLSKCKIRRHRHHQQQHQHDNYLQQQPLENLIVRLVSSSSSHNNNNTSLESPSQQSLQFALQRHYIEPEQFLELLQPALNLSPKLSPTFEKRPQTTSHQLTDATNCKLPHESSQQPDCITDSTSGAAGCQQGASLGSGGQWQQQSRSSVKSQSSSLSSSSSSSDSEHIELLASRLESQDCKMTKMALEDDQKSNDNNDCQQSRLTKNSLNSNNNNNNNNSDSSSSHLSEASPSSPPVSSSTVSPGATRHGRRRRRITERVMSVDKFNSSRKSKHQSARHDNDDELPIASMSQLRSVSMSALQDAAPFGRGAGHLSSKDRTNGYNDRPLSVAMVHLAIVESDQAIVDTLFQKQNKHLLAQEDNMGLLPLHKSVIMGHVELTKRLVRRLLLDSGTSISSLDKFGRTALHYAAGLGDERHRLLTKFLIGCGINPCVRDNDGHTAEYYRCHSMTLPKELNDLLLLNQPQQNNLAAAAVSPGQIRSSFPACTKSVGGGRCFKELTSQQQQQQQQRQRHNQATRNIRDRIIRCLTEGSIDKISELVVEGHGQHLYEQGQNICWNLPCRHYIRQVVPKLIMATSRLHELILKNDLVGIKTVLSHEPMLIKIKRQYKQCAMNGAHFACLHNRVKIVKFILDNYPEMIHSRDSQQRTCLHIAAATAAAAAVARPTQTTESPALQLYRMLVQSYHCSLAATDNKGYTARDYLLLHQHQHQNHRQQQTKKRDATVVELLDREQARANQLQMVATKSKLMPRQQANRFTRNAASKGNGTLKQQWLESDADSQRADAAAADDNMINNDHLARPRTILKQSRSEDDIISVLSSRADDDDDDIDFLASTADDRDGRGDDGDDQVNIRAPTALPTPTFTIDQGGQESSKFNWGQDSARSTSPTNDNNDGNSIRQRTDNKCKLKNESPCLTNATNKMPRAASARYLEAPVKTTMFISASSGTTSLTATSQKNPRRFSDHVCGGATARKSSIISVGRGGSFQMSQRTNISPTSRQVRSSSEVIWGDLREPQATGSPMGDTRAQSGEAKSLELNSIDLLNELTNLVADDDDDAGDDKNDADGRDRWLLMKSDEADSTAQICNGDRRGEETSKRRGNEPIETTNLMLRNNSNDEEKEKLSESKLHQDTATNNNNNNSDEVNSVAGSSIQSQISLLPLSRPGSATTINKLQRIIRQAIYDNDINKLEHIIIAGRGEHLMSLYEEEFAHGQQQQHQHSMGGDQSTTKPPMMKLSGDIVDFFENLAPLYLNKVTQIHRLVLENNLHELKRTLNKKRLALSRDYYGATPLHLAIVKQQLNIFKYLVDKYPQCMSAPDNEGRLPVHYAAICLNYHLNHQQRHELDQQQENVSHANGLVKTRSFNQFNQFKSSPTGADTGAAQSNVDNVAGNNREQPSGNATIGYMFNQLQELGLSHCISANLNVPTLSNVKDKLGFASDDYFATCGATSSPEASVAEVHCCQRYKELISRYDNHLEDIMATASSDHSNSKQLFDHTNTQSIASASKKEQSVNGHQTPVQSNCPTVDIWRRQDEFTSPHKQQADCNNYKGYREQQQRHEPEEENCQLQVIDCEGTRSGRQEKSMQQSKIEQNNINEQLLLCNIPQESLITKIERLNHQPPEQQIAYGATVEEINHNSAATKTLACPSLITGLSREPLTDTSDDQLTIEEPADGRYCHLSPELAAPTASASPCISVDRFFPSLVNANEESKDDATNVMSVDPRAKSEIANEQQNTKSKHETRHFAAVAAGSNATVDGKEEEQVQEEEDDDDDDDDMSIYKRGYLLADRSAEIENFKLKQHNNDNNNNNNNSDWTLQSKLMAMNQSMSSSAASMETSWRNNNGSTCNKVSLDMSAVINDDSQYLPFIASLPQNSQSALNVSSSNNSNTNDAATNKQQQPQPHQPAQFKAASSSSRTTQKLLMKNTLIPKQRCKQTMVGGVIVPSIMHNDNMEKVECYDVVYRRSSSFDQRQSIPLLDNTSGSGGGIGGATSNTKTNSDKLNSYTNVLNNNSSSDAMIGGNGQRKISNFSSSSDEEIERVERLSTEFENTVKREKNELRTRVDQIMNDIRMTSKSIRTTGNVFTTNRVVTFDHLLHRSNNACLDMTATTTTAANAKTATRAGDNEPKRQRDKSPSGMPLKSSLKQQRNLTATAPTTGGRVGAPLPTVRTSSISSSGRSSIVTSSTASTNTGGGGASLSSSSSSSSSSSAGSHYSNSAPSSAGSSCCSGSCNNQNGHETQTRKAPQKHDDHNNRQNQPEPSDNNRKCCLEAPTTATGSKQHQSSSRHLAELTGQVPVKNAYGQTYLHFISSQMQNSHTFYKILSTHGSQLISERDIFYRTMRDIASQFNLLSNVQVIDQFIIDAFVGENIQLLKHLQHQGYSPLIHVADQDGNDIMLILKLLKSIKMIQFLQQLADFQKWRDELHTFIRHGYRHGVSVLIKKHLDLITAKSVYSRTSAHIATLFERFDILEELIRMDKRSIYCTDNMGRTALHYAYGIQSDKADYIRNMLIGAGSDETARDVKMRTPKYYYVFKHEIQDIKRLEYELV